MLKYVDIYIYIVDWNLKPVQHLLQPIHGINLVEMKKNILKIVEIY